MRESNFRISQDPSNLLLVRTPKDETGENTEEADAVEDDDDEEGHFEPMASSDDPEGVQSAAEDAAEDLNGSLTDVSSFTPSSLLCELQWKKNDGGC